MIQEKPPAPFLRARGSLLVVPIVIIIVTVTVVLVLRELGFGGGAVAHQGDFLVDAGVGLTPSVVVALVDGGAVKAISEGYEVREIVRTLLESAINGR